MTVQLVLTHLLGAACGAALAWAVHRLRAAAAVRVAAAAPASGATLAPEQAQAAPVARQARELNAAVEPEQRLQQQTEHVQVLLNRLSVATQAAGMSAWEMDLRTQQLTWVGDHLSIFGLGELPLEQYTAAVRELIHPDDRHALINDVEQDIAAGQQTYSSRFRLRHPDGSVRHMRTYAHIVRDESGRPTRLIGVTSDVTSEVETTELLRRQAEQERALIQRLSISADAAGICSWEMDLKANRFLWIENPLAGLGDIPAIHDDAVERHYERMSPGDKERMRETVQHALKHNLDRITYRYQARKDNGELACIESHARILRDPARNSARLLGVSRDVTKEVEAFERLTRQTQMLEDAERRLAKASLSSSEGHWELDLLRERIWVSSSYQALLGQPDSALTARSEELLENIHPEDRSGALAAMRDHILRGLPFLCDIRLRTAAGDHRWFRHRGMAERNATGRAVSISGSIQDVHEQKQAEDALKLAQRRLERAINGTQDGLWELEVDDTAWFSPRVAELLGYSPEEAPNDAGVHWQLLHPEDRAIVIDATRAHYQQGSPYDIEIRLRTKSGEYRWFRARASAERDAEGRPLRLSGSLQDVTEARAAREALLRATEAAEAANRAKSEFLANVSHEIRTPMNGILGMTDLMLDTALDRTQRDYAETIRSSADSLLSVINDILDFSKIEAGKLDIEAIDLDLRANVEEVGGLLAFQAAAKNLELIVHVHPDVPEHVLGDPQRLRQCLTNLVGNAVKFTQQGEVVIEVSRLGERDGRVLTRFEVRDTGIGVDPQMLRSLFQPFVQADSSTTRHFGGTGLGLSIVRRLAQIMGGDVGASSEPGKGSVFWFTLPLAPRAAAGAAPQLDLNRLGRRVLVVDDNATNRRVLAGQLQHAGYDVSLADGGQEALRLLRAARLEQLPFEVVLVDHQMQELDGATLGERINSDPELSGARTVMLTSVDRHGDTQLFASLGFAAYLTKPVRARELLACLDRVLAHDSKEWHMHTQPIVTRGALISARAPVRQGAKVLLVEDNSVNQKVAVRFLKRMGCEVCVADNGAEGVRAYREAGFDLVLMDLQMPVMDGLTATRRIRELEANGRKTPIVALTANAMAGQLERCLEAGMDGFLTKPLDVARLQEMLERHGLGMSPQAAAPAAAPEPGMAPVDLGRLNEITDGDAEFARELVETFVASSEQVMQEMRAALAALDRPALSRAAHKIKGASANIHAEPLRQLAYDLESQVSSLEQARLKDLIGQLEMELTRAGQFLLSQLPQPIAKAG